MLAEAWEQVRIQTITTTFRHLLWSSEKMLHLPMNNALDEDDISLIELFHHLVPGNNFQNDQILDLAHGINEKFRSLITDGDIFDDINNDENDNDEGGSSTDTEEVLKCVNNVINWTESNLSISDISFLRNIRKNYSKIDW